MGERSRRTEAQDPACSCPSLVSRGWTRLQDASEPAAAVTQGSLCRVHDVTQVLVGACPHTAHALAGRGLLGTSCTVLTPAS